MHVLTVESSAGWGSEGNSARGSVVKLECYDIDGACLCLIAAAGIEVWRK